MRGDVDRFTLGSVVLTIGTTAPVAWVAVHWLAPVTITLASAVALVYDERLTIAGLIGLVITFYVVASKHAAWFAAVLATPLVLIALGNLLVDSGPATSDDSITEGATTSEAEPFEPEGPEPDDGINTHPLLAAALALGGAGAGLMQRTRTTEERLVEREASIADVTLAHSAQGERVRIARELHDVVAHRITSIAVQAETARLTTPGLSPEGAERLTEIGQSARDALGEMRQLLGVLRKDVKVASKRAPQPGVADLNQLIKEARSLSGASIRLTISGQVTALDPALELTAYRIVQEALTNARRHAPGAAVDVELGYGESELRVEVRDTGGPAAAGGNGPGHGLLGIRERVEMAGGNVLVGRAPSGGFVVTATLPHGTALWTGR